MDPGSPSVFGYTYEQCILRRKEGRFLFCITRSIALFYLLIVAHYFGIIIIAPSTRDYCATLPVAKDATVAEVMCDDQEIKESTMQRVTQTTEANNGHHHLNTLGARSVTAHRTIAHRDTPPVANHSTSASIRRRFQFSLVVSRSGR